MKDILKLAPARLALLALLALLAAATTACDARPADDGPTGDAAATTTPAASGTPTEDLDSATDVPATPSADLVTVRLAVSGMG